MLRPTEFEGFKDSTEEKRYAVLSAFQPMPRTRNSAWSSTRCVFSRSRNRVSHTVHLQQHARDSTTIRTTVVYSAGSAAFLMAYAQATHLDLRDMFARNWTWSAKFWSDCRGFLVVRVLSSERSDTSPGRRLFRLFHRLARAALRRRRCAGPHRVPGRCCVRGFRPRSGEMDCRDASATRPTLALSLLITATYHLGYDQFRETASAAPSRRRTCIHSDTCIADHESSRFNRRARHYARHRGYHCPRDAMFPAAGHEC